MNVREYLGEHPNPVVAGFWDELQGIGVQSPEIFESVVENFPTDERYMSLFQIAYLSGAGKLMRQDAVGDLKSRCLSLQKGGQSYFEECFERGCSHEKTREYLLLLSRVLAGILGDYGCRCFFDAVESAPSPSITEKDVDNANSVQLYFLAMFLKEVEDAPVEGTKDKGVYVGIRTLLEINVLMAKAIDEGVI